jgi:Protein of unknown function (DUF2281)
VSTAEKIYQKAQTLPEQAQDALLRLTEMLAANRNTSKPNSDLKAGSAKGLIEISADFDEPLEDFKPHME